MHAEDAMQRAAVAILTLTICCALTTGCTSLKPADPDMFYGNCITPPGPDPCESDMDICQVYKDIIIQEHPSAAACRAACIQASVQLGNQYFARSCGYMVLGGANQCEQQCLRMYPEQQ